VVGFFIWDIQSLYKLIFFHGAAATPYSQIATIRMAVKQKRI